MRESAPVPNTLRLWLAGAIIGIGIVFVYVVFQASRGSEAIDLRAMDQAQMARNLARGAGFTTEFIRPLSLARIPQISNHPDLYQAPLHPVFMSLLFRAFGASPRVISWSSGILFLLTLPLVLWIGWKVFSRKVALLSVVAVALNSAVLFTAASGTEGGLLTLLITAAAVVCIYHARVPARRRLFTLLAGALAALCYLTSYVWIMAFPALLLVVLLNVPARQRRQTAVLFVLAYVVVTLPWGLRNQRLTGTPFPRLYAYETIQGTRTHSGNTLLRSYDPAPESVLGFMATSPREMYEKVHDNAVNLYPLLFAIGGVVIMPFFIVAILIPLGVAGVPPVIDRLRLGTYLLLVLLFIILTLVVPDGRLLMPLVPLLTVVAAAFFYQLLDLRLRTGTERFRVRWTNAAVALLLVLQGFPLLLQLARGRPVMEAAPAATRRASNELNALIREMSIGADSSSQPVYTDVPWAVAWYADRPAIWLPHTDADVRRIEQNVGQVRWLVLTPQISDVATAEKATPWADIWRRGLSEKGTFGGWRVRQRLANGAWVLLERVPDIAAVGGVGASPVPAATR